MAIIYIANYCLLLFDGTYPDWMMERSSLNLALGVGMGLSIPIILCAKYRSLESNLGINAGVLITLPLGIVILFTTLFRGV